MTTSDYHRHRPTLPVRTY